MAHIPVSDKVIEKWRKEDIELHKRVITDYLHSIGLSYYRRQQFFKIYDHYITPKNILKYFYRPAKLFVKALILDKLDEIGDIWSFENREQRPKKRKSKKNR